MQPNPILAEIRHTRDEMARQAGYDVRRLMTMIRERERASAARGVVFAAPTVPDENSCVVREEPARPQQP